MPEQGVPAENPSGMQEEQVGQPAGIPLHRFDGPLEHPMAMEQGGVNYDPNQAVEPPESPSAPQVTCPEEYCNQPVGHTTRHGVVNREVNP